MNARENGFGREFTLGVEEELFLVDGGSLEAVPAVERVVPEPDERLKYELFRCMVETTTPICDTAREGQIVPVRDRGSGTFRRGDP